MAKELLVIPEEDLDEVIYVIRAGIRFCQAIPIDPLVKGRKISSETINMLTKWCYEEAKYLSNEYKIRKVNDLG